MFRLIRYLAVILAVILALYMIADKIIVYAIKKAYNVDISYSQSRNHFFKTVSFNNFTMTDRKLGVGFRSEQAYLVPVFSKSGLGIISMRFDLKNVHFITKSDTVKDAYSDIFSVISMPFTSHWAYKEVSGEVEPIKGGLRVKSLEAVSEAIKISFKGDLFHNDTIDINITVHLSDKALGKIPEEFANMVLSQEADGWRSISANLKGDYSSPSIQLTGKLFKLSITSISK